MKDINELLERYYEGATTREEEEWIRYYLANQKGEAVTADEQLFAGINALRAGAPANQRRKAGRIPLRYLGFAATGIAASIALFIALKSDPVIKQTEVKQTLTAQLIVTPGTSGEITDEEKALEQARRALAFVSRQLNKGTEGMGQLHHLDKSISKIQNKEAL